MLFASSLALFFFRLAKAMEFPLRPISGSGPRFPLVLVGVRPHTPHPRPACPPAVNYRQVKISPIFSSPIVAGGRCEGRATSGRWWPEDGLVDGGAEDALVDGGGRAEDALLDALVDDAGRLASARSPHRRHAVARRWSSGPARTRCTSLMHLLPSSCLLHTDAALSQRGRDVPRRGTLPPAVIRELSERDQAAARDLFLVVVSCLGAARELVLAGNLRKVGHGGAAPP